MSALDCIQYLVDAMGRIEREVSLARTGDLSDEQRHFLAGQLSGVRLVAQALASLLPQVRP